MQQVITLRGFPCEPIGGNQAGKLLEARALYDICGSSGFLLLLNLSWDDSTDHDNDPDHHLLLLCLFSPGVASSGMMAV